MGNDTGTVAPGVAAAYGGAVGGLTAAYLLAVWVSADFVYRPLWLAAAAILGAAAGLGVQRRIRRSIVARATPPMTAGEAARLAAVPPIMAVGLALVVLPHLAGNSWFVVNLGDPVNRSASVALAKCALAVGPAMLAMLATFLLVVMTPASRRVRTALGGSAWVWAGGLLLVHVAVVVCALLVLPSFRHVRIEVERGDVVPVSPPSEVLRADGASLSWAGLCSAADGRPYETATYWFSSDGSLRLAVPPPSSAVTALEYTVTARRRQPAWLPFPVPWQGPLFASRRLGGDAAAPGEIAVRAVMPSGETVAVEAPTAVPEGGQSRRRLPLERAPHAARAIELVVTPDGDFDVGVLRIGRRVARTPRRHVVLVSLDTHALQHMSLFGDQEVDTSPSLRRLLAEHSLAAGYAGAIATSYYTLPSHASEWTGVYPSQHGLVESERTLAFADSLRTLPELLHASAAARTFVLSSGQWVDAIHGYGRGADFFRSYRQSHGERGRRVLDDAFEILRGHPDEDILILAHLFDAHAPYTTWPQNARELLAGGEARFPSELYSEDGPFAETQRGRALHPLQRRETIARYSAEVLPAMPAALRAYQLGMRSVDDMIGAFLDKLMAAGLLDDTTLIFVGDHGEEFFDHGTLTHRSVYDENLRVPFVVKLAADSSLRPPAAVLPKACPYLFEAHTTVFRVILDLFGVPLPAQVERAGTAGLGLMDLLTLAADQPVLSELHASPAGTLYEASAYEPGRRHVILSSYADGAPIRQIVEPYLQVFDLDHDPRELVNLAPPGSPESVAATASMLARMRRVWDFTTTPSERGELDDDERAALRALGYVQ